MANRVQIGYPAVIRAVKKPKRIEIGKIIKLFFVLNSNIVILDILFHEKTSICLS